MLYEESKDAFEAVLIRDLKGTLDGKHVFKRKAFNRERLSLLIWPLAETSMAKKETTRVFERSATKGAYFSVLKNVTS